MGAAWGTRAADANCSARPAALLSCDGLGGLPNASAVRLATFLRLCGHEPLRSTLVRLA